MDILDLMKTETKLCIRFIVPSLLLKRVQKDAKWTLFCPMDVPDFLNVKYYDFEKIYTEYENDDSLNRKVLKARDLLKLFAT